MTSPHADAAQVVADPGGPAAAARRHVEASASAIVVHVDVDAVDSADLPLANYPHHGKGLTFDAVMTVLRELCTSPAFAGLVLTEVNPTHNPGGELLSRYIDGVAAAWADRRVDATATVPQICKTTTLMPHTHSDQIHPATGRGSCGLPCCHASTCPGADLVRYYRRP